MYLIHKVAEEDSEDSLRALAFAVMVKANFVSSTFKDATITALMSYFHLKHNTLKKALNRALEMGLVQMVERIDKNGKQHTDLKALKLNADGQRSIKLNMCDTKYGRAVYIHSNHTDLNIKYEYTDAPQSIINVMDILLTAKVLSLFKQHNKCFDYLLRQACLEAFPDNGKKLWKKSCKTLESYERLYRVLQKRIPVGTINGLNSGFSIERIQSYFGAYVTRYKIEKLLHQANQKHDHLFRVWENESFFDQTERIKNHSYEIKQTPKNASPFEIFQVAYDNYDLKVDGMRKAYQERFIDTDEDGNVINLYQDRGCTIAPQFKRCLSKPMANTYYLQCNPFVTSGRKPKRELKMTVPIYKMELETSSVSCHVSDINLPF